MQIWIASEPSFWWGWKRKVIQLTSYGCEGCWRLCQRYHISHSGSSWDFCLVKSVVICVLKQPHAGLWEPTATFSEALLSWLSSLWWEHYTVEIGKGYKASLPWPLESRLWNIYQHTTGGSPLSSTMINMVFVGVRVVGKSNGNIMAITFPAFFKILMMVLIFAVPLEIWFCLIFSILGWGKQRGHFRGYRLAFPTTIALIPKIKNLM